MQLTRRTGRRGYASFAASLRRFLVAACVCLSVCAAAPAAIAQVWLGVGYDGVSQEFFLTTIDTSGQSADVIEEFRRTATSINEEQVLLRTRVGRLLIWDQTTALTSLYWQHRTSLLAYTDRGGRTWGGLEYRFNMKRPHTERETGAFSNFVFQEIRGTLERRFGSAAVRLRGIGELVHYPEPGLLTYDYRQFRGEVQIGRSTEPLHFQEATVLLIRRDVPDSARFSYLEAGLNLGMGWTMGLWRAGVALEFADRRYDLDQTGLDHGAIRLHANWNDDGLQARWPGLLEVEGYHYHDRTSLLSDFLRLEFRQRRAFPLSRGWTPYIEPGVESVWSAVDEDYLEPRMAIGTELFTLRGWWASAEARVGHRNYPNGSISGLTDFWRLGFNLFFDAPLWPRVTLNVVYTQDWEWHSEISDNLSLFLLSAGIRYRM